MHGIRAAMQSLKKTGTDFTSAQGMDPKAFFEVMGRFPSNYLNTECAHTILLGLNDVTSLDARAGGSAFDVV